jgi:hypothetical protein
MNVKEQFKIKFIWFNFKFWYSFRTFENVHILCLKIVNFTNDYQKDSYNKKNFIEKIIDDKNIPHSKNIHNFKNVEF